MHLKISLRERAKVSDGEREREWVIISLPSAVHGSKLLLYFSPLRLQSEHARRWKRECNPVKVKFTDMLLDNVQLRVSLCFQQLNMTTPPECPATFRDSDIYEEQSKEKAFISQTEDCPFPVFSVKFARTF